MLIGKCRQECADGEAYLVSETLDADAHVARRYWSGENPIGTPIAWKTAGDERLSGEIIGVV